MDLWPSTKDETTGPALVSHFHRTQGDQTPLAEKEPTEEERLAQSREIEERLAQERAPREFPQVTDRYSPSYRMTLPKTAMELHRVTPEEEELILFHYASTSSIPKTVEASGIKVDKVRAVVYSPETAGRLGEWRDKLRISVIQRIEETQAAILEGIQDPEKIKQASITQLASVFTDISEMQINMITAQREAAGRSSLTSDPTSLFTGEDLEYMALLRRRLNSPQTAIPSGSQVDNRDDSHHSMEGHEFVDTAFHNVPLEIITVEAEVEE